MSSPFTVLGLLSLERIENQPVDDFGISCEECDWGRMGPQEDQIQWGRFGRLTLAGFTTLMVQSRTGFATTERQYWNLPGTTGAGRRLWCCWDDSNVPYGTLAALEEQGLLPPFGMVENVSIDLKQRLLLLGSLNAGFEAIGAWHLRQRHRGELDAVYRAAESPEPLSEAIRIFYP